MTDPRLYPTRPFLAASVAVIRDGRILLAARGRPPLDGLFSLPGGLVEPGETLAAAALRELREEVAVEAEILGFLAPVELIETDAAGRAERHVVICAHVARWIAGEGTVGAEAREIRWIGPGEIRSLPVTPGLAAILDLAFGFAGREVLQR